MTSKQLIKKITTNLNGDWSPTSQLREELMRPNSPAFEVPNDFKHKDIEEVLLHFSDEWIASIIYQLKNENEWPLISEPNIVSTHLIFAPKNTQGEHLIQAWVFDFLKSKTEANTTLAFETRLLDFSDPTGPRGMFKIGCISFDEDQTPIVVGSVTVDVSSVIPYNQNAMNKAVLSAAKFLKICEKLNDEDNLPKKQETPSK